MGNSFNAETLRRGEKRFAEGSLKIHANVGRLLLTYSFYVRYIKKRHGNRFTATQREIRCVCVFGEIATLCRWDWVWDWV